jgi:outer membrane receptor protein involved in Fe transport
LTSNTGFRYDRHQLTGRGYFSPRLGFSFRLNQTTNLNLAAGRSYQSPDWYQLAMNTANRRLGSKYTDQAVLGLERLFSEDLRGTAEIYYKKYRDVPIPLSLATDDPNDFSSSYVNRGRGHAKGIELFLQKKVKRDFWGTASYSYSISRAEDPRSPGLEYDWDFDYRHVLTLIAGYRRDLSEKGWYKSMRGSLWYRASSWLPLLPADETELSFKWRYLGGRPYTPQTYHAEWRRWTLDPGQPVNSARMKPYSRFDLHLQRRWYFGRLSLISYFDLQNIFNSRNEWMYLYDEDGTIDVVYQFSRMLVGGVVLEF